MRTGAVLVRLQRNHWQAYWKDWWIRKSKRAKLYEVVIQKRFSMSLWINHGTLNDMTTKKYETTNREVSKRSLRRVKRSNHWVHQLPIKTGFFMNAKNARPRSASWAIRTRRLLSEIIVYRFSHGTAGTQLESPTEVPEAGVTSNRFHELMFFKSWRQRLESIAHVQGK